MSEFAGPSADSLLLEVVDDLGDAVIARDAGSGEVVAVNGTVEELFGYTPAAFRELGIDECAVSPAQAQDARTGAERTARETGSGTYRWEVERHDGTTFWAESTVSPTTVGERECFVSVVRDVTEQTERERELERFAEILTHDLRSPLNAAQAQVGILRGEVRGGEEFLDRLERVHGRMADIVDDVRTLVSHGDRIENPVQVDLNQVVDGAWEAVVGGRDGRSAHGNARGAPTLVVEDGLGTVTADESRIGRLFENLFENAVRHATGDSGVTVTVSTTPRGRGIVVADDGPGIVADDRERVFDYGYTTADRGTGFGLNIVSAVADSHGWDVDVREADSGGARFEITGMWDDPARRGDAARE